MKQLIKYVLKKLGYEIRPLHLNGASNSIDYNHCNHVDAFYNNEQLTQDYIKNNVPLHIKNLFTLLGEKKIDLNNKSVMDIGCGTGHALRELKAHYPQAHVGGSEFSEAAINLASKIIPGIPVAKWDITDTMDTGPYDAVLCQQVLEHITEAETALKNLWSITAPGGFLLLTIPDGRIDTFSGHIHFWSKEGFNLFLKKNLVLTGDFEIEHMQDGVSLYALLHKQG